MRSKERVSIIEKQSEALFRKCKIQVAAGGPVVASKDETIRISFSGLSGSRIKVLNVGKELTQEVLPLRTGQCLYELHGLKAMRWYEVKISYPASIPTSFSIKLIKYNSTKLNNLGRRLLNTEKLIFEADSILLETSGYSGICAFVSVKPAGVVAKSYLKEQHSVVFNIVCEELVYGILYQAWWVGFLVVFGLLVSCLIPKFLPPELLPRKGSPKSMKRVSSTDLLSNDSTFYKYFQLFVNYS